MIFLLCCSFPGNGGGGNGGTSGRFFPPWRRAAQAEKTRAGQAQKRQVPRSAVRARDRGTGNAPRFARALGRVGAMMPRLRKPAGLLTGFLRVGHREHAGNRAGEREKPRSGHPGAPAPQARSRACTKTRSTKTRSPSPCGSRGEARSAPPGIGHVGAAPQQLSGAALSTMTLFLLTRKIQLLLKLEHIIVGDTML